MSFDRTRGGAVGIVADAAGRYTSFSECLSHLSVPGGTQFDWVQGADRGVSRNTIVERALLRKSQWVFFLDDDHTFEPGHLLRMLERKQPALASLYLQRVPPFLPIAYAEKDENGYWPLDITACPDHGLVTVVAAGTGGMLIDADVFRQLEAPWFVHTTGKSEDLYFCDKLAETGIPLYVDMRARLGHIAPVSVYPAYEKGAWGAGLALARGSKVVLPIEIPK